MNAGPDVERLISDWLVEEAPARAPDRILETAAHRSAHTRQRRFGAVRRTFPDMKISWQLAAAAVVGILVIALGAAYLGRNASGGVGGGPAATATPSPTATATESAAPTPESAAPTPVPTVPPLTQTFTSSLHGYSIKYPAGWTAIPATAAWPPGPGLTWGNAGLDELRGATARLVGTSQPLAAGQSAEAWMRAYGGDPSAWHPIAIGDQTGFIAYDGSMAASGTIVPGGLLFDAVVVVDGRGYNFTLDGYVDHDYFAAMLATVVLDPASAVDPTAAP